MAIMKIVTYTYEYTQYLRTSTNDGMDSEPAGTTISLGTFKVAVPNDNTWALEVADVTLRNHSGNARDPAFKVVSKIVSELDAIVYAPVWRI